jgi:hypothetical protein
MEVRSHLYPQKAGQTTKNTPKSLFFAREFVVYSVSASTNVEMEVPIPVLDPLSGEEPYDGPPHFYIIRRVRWQPNISFSPVG